MGSRAAANRVRTALRARAERALCAGLINAGVAAAEHGSPAMMQTVPLALVRGAEGQPEERTLGTAVLAGGWTLAGTGALECQPSAGTERNWALQCPSPARHWPPVSLPEATFPPLFSLKLLSNHSENGLYLA